MKVELESLKRASHFIAEQKCKSQLMREGIVELMEIWPNESYSVLVKEQIQSQMGSRCPQENKLDGEIDKLWKLIQFSKISYNRVKQTPHWEIGLKVKNYEGRSSGPLQYKVWKSGMLQPTRNDEGYSVFIGLFKLIKSNV